MNYKIAFGGKMGVGKDTAVNYMISKLGGEKTSFAGPIYDILYYAQDKCMFKKEKDRKFLQFIGTDWARKIDPLVWIRLVLNKQYKNNVYLSDLRFINEFKHLKNNGWICIKIQRSQKSIKNNRKGTGSSKHISETSLSSIPDKDWDYIIDNNNNIREFYKKLDDIIKNIKYNK